MANRNKTKKKKFLLFAFSFIFLFFTFLFVNSLSVSNSSNLYDVEDDLVLTSSPSDTIQKNISYQTTQLNNETGENETITKYKLKNTYIVETDTKSFSIEDTDKVKIDINVKRTHLGDLLSGGNFDVTQATNNINSEGYLYERQPFTETQVQDLRNELEDMTFEVTRGNSDQLLNVPNGIANTPHGSFNLKAVIQTDKLKNSFTTFKLGSHSINYDLTTSLVSYYSLQETSGDVLDSHGTNDGTNNGATRGVTGQVGNAFDFDGTDDYIDETKDGIWGIADGFTLNAWIKTSGVTENKQIITRDFFGSGIPDDKRFFQFRVQSDGTLNLIRFDSSNNVVASPSSTTTLDDGNWHLVTATFDTTDGSKLYIDGNQDGSDGTTTQNNDGGEGNITIGAAQNGYESGDVGAEQFKDFFDGKIDEVGIWNKALNSTEVSDLYNNGDGLSYDSLSGTEPTGVSVDTLPAENIYTYSADLKGNLTNLADETNVTSYFQYKEDENTDWINTSEQYLTTTGEYTQNLTELYDNTTYEYRAVTEYNNTNITYGDNVTFTTDIAPYFTYNSPENNKHFFVEDTTENIDFDVDFNNPDSYNLINATLEIDKISDDSEVSIPEFWVDYSQTQTTFPLSNYTFNLDYEQDTSYRWRMKGYFENGGIHKIGGYEGYETNSFYIDDPSEINVLEATEIKDTSVKLNGEVLNYNDLNSVDYKFQYREVGNTDWINTSENTINSPDTAFSSNIFSLNNNTDYEYRVFYEYDENNYEYFSDTTEIKNFTTYKEPNVETLPATNITAFESKLKGNVTSISYYDDVEVYFEYRRIG